MKTKLFYWVSLSFLPIVACFCACSKEDKDYTSTMYITSGEIELNAQKAKVSKYEQATLTLSANGSNMADIAFDFIGSNGYKTSFTAGDVLIKKTSKSLSIDHQDVMTDVSLGNDHETDIYSISCDLSREGSFWEGLLTFEGTSYGQKHLFTITEVSTDINDFIPCPCYFEDAAQTIEIQHLVNASDAPIILSFKDYNEGLVSYEIAPGAEQTIICYAATMMGCSGCLEHGEDVVITDNGGNVRTFPSNVTEGEGWISHDDFSMAPTCTWTQGRSSNRLLTYK